MCGFTGCVRFKTEGQKREKMHYSSQVEKVGILGTCAEFGIRNLLIQVQAAREKLTDLAFPHLPSREDYEKKGWMKEFPRSVSYQSPAQWKKIFFISVPRGKYDEARS